MPGWRCSAACGSRTGTILPAPNAKFVNAGHYDNTLDRCRYICNDKAMDVYELDDIGRETEEMVSVRTRQSYRDLPPAFAYREMADFHGCDLPRYYRRADEMRARTVIPKNMEAAVIPLPQAKSELFLDGTVTDFRTRSAGDDAQGPHRRGAVPADRFASVFFALSRHLCALGVAKMSAPDVRKGAAWGGQGRAGVTACCCNVSLLPENQPGLCLVGFCYLSLA